MFFDKNQFPLIAGFEKQWPAINAELKAYFSNRNGTFVPHPVRGIHTNDWSMCGIYLKLDDGTVQNNSKNFPQTVEYIQGLPGIIKAGFSRLTPGTRIKSHTDPFNNEVRIHLGVVIPDEKKCGLMVNGKTVRWKNGQCLMFNDTQVHQAWNNADSDRIILSVDLDIDMLLRTSGHPVPNGAVGYHHIKKFALRKSAAENLMGYWQNAAANYYQARGIAFGIMGRFKRFLLKQPRKPVVTDNYIAAGMESAPVAEAVR